MDPTVTCLLAIDFGNKRYFHDEFLAKSDEQANKYGKVH